MTDEKRKISILCFGERWDKDRGRDKELISSLIKRPEIRDIILIEPPLSFTSIIHLWRKKCDEDIRKTWQRIFKRGIIWQPAEGIWVASPILPFVGTKRRLSWFYNILRKFIAKWIMRRLNIERLVLWLGTPYFTSALIGYFNEELVCYSLTEDFCEKDPINKNLLFKEDEKISNKADLIFVVSKELAERHKKYQGKVRVVTEGVDLEFITRMKDNVFFPGYMEKIKKPIIGFVGEMNKNIDFELIYYIAERRPDWSIMMIGSYANGIHAQIRNYVRPNLYFLDKKPFEFLPGYISKFDVGILPYKENSQNKKISPVKIYLYLALGKPIVGRPVTDTDLFDGIISIAGDSQSFVNAVEKALENNNDVDSQKRISLAEAHSWDNRSGDIYSGIIEKFRELN